MYDRVFKGPPRCGAGKIANPRTSRCVSTSLPLGAAIKAAAEALMAGQTPPRACPGGAYDFATGECVTDRPRVQALRDLVERWAVAEAANRNSAAVAKLMTASALASAAGANNRAAAARANRNATNLRNQAMYTHVRLAEAERQKAQAVRDRDACRQDLALARQELAAAQGMLRQLDAALSARYPANYLGANAPRANAPRANTRAPAKPKPAKMSKRPAWR